MLRHKDGDVLNSNLSNLEWVPVIPTPAAGQFVSGYYIIDENGNIFDDGVKMSVTDIQYDSDMDLIVTVRPYFNDNDNRRVAVDDVVAGAAGFIAEDRSALKNPAILHKDHDRLNYKRDNLQWVEQDSQEYQDYKDAEKQYVRNKNITMNPS